MLRLGAVAVAIVLSTLSSSVPASGASTCASAVLRDWSDDGQVAPRYSLPCYEEAIDALPTDLRDYSDAEDVITRALTRAVRTNTSTRVADGTDDRGVPLTVVAIAGAAFSVLLAGGASYGVRRVRPD